MRPFRRPARHRRPLARLKGDGRGATAVEYGLIAALIVIAMLALFKEVANLTVSMWGNINARTGNATGYGPA